MSDLKTEIDATIRQMMNTADRTIWFRFLHNYRIRIGQRDRVELESEVPGYDQGPPICIQPSELQSVGEFLIVLGKVLEKKTADVAKRA